MHIFLESNINLKIYKFLLLLELANMLPFKEMLYILIFQAINTSTTKELKLGFLINFSHTREVIYYRYAGAVTKVVDDINNDPNLLNGTKVTFIYKDCGCNGSRGLGGTVDLYNENVAAFIGPPCSKSCLSGGLLSTNKKIPMISYGCSSIALSDTNNFPYFARTKPFARGSKKWTPKTFVAVMNFYKWTKACLIESVHEIFTPLAKETVNAFLKNNLIISSHEKYNTDQTDFEDKEEIIMTMKDKCRSKSPC